MRLLSCSRMSCWVNWNCRDYINGINELWLPDASAFIKTAWWAKWTQADKRTGSILWAYRLLMRKTLLPLFSTDMSVECSDYWGSSSEQGCKQKHWGGDGNKTQILETQDYTKGTCMHFCFVAFYQIHSTLNLLSFFPDFFSFKDVCLVVNCN